VPSTSLASLLITGNHPAAGWLAVYLARRAWPVTWIPQEAPPNLLVYGLEQTLPTLFGAAPWCWPLEWCVQELVAIHRHSEAFSGLAAWQAAVLDPVAIWRDTRREAQHLNLLTQTGDLRIPAAVLHLELSFESCSHAACPMGRVGHLDGQALAAGFLQQFSQAGAELYLTGFGPRQLIFTGLDSEAEILQQLWTQALPLALTGPEACRQQPICRVQPTLVRQKNKLVLRVPEPSLLPESLVSQAIYWFMIRYLAQALSTGSIPISQLGSGLQSLQRKIQTALITHAESCNFFPIPD